MPIATGDIKLLKSAVMADVPEGGGPPTGNAIPDGVSNAIFPDISELDRAMGRVSLRKVFAAVQTPDTDSYFGANLIVAEPPRDPRVSVSLFSQGRTFDTRAQAASRIEAYLNKGPEWPGLLYENHIAGQRVIQLFQRVSAATPTPGQTLCLVENEGLPTQKEQYVRVTKVSSVVQTFTYGIDQDYQAAVVTCDISDALRFDFTGTSANRQFQRAAAACKVRDTVVADASIYAGVVPLAQGAAIGDLSVRVASIFTQIVPSAQSETPIPLSAPHAASGLPVSGTHPVSFTTSQNWNTTTALVLPGGCLPGSLTVTVGSTTVTDDAGRLKTASGEIGTIDYANGELTLLTGSLPGTKSVTYTPAAFLDRAPQSTEIPVTAATRSLSYTGVLAQVPAPGTMAVSYRAQGRWYTLADGGNGQLRGLDASYGAGTVNTDTGGWVVTLGALPDVGSSVVITWQLPTQEDAQPVATLKAAQTITLAPPAGKTIQPGSVSITWTDGATTRTATANAAGTLSGDATGRVNVARNQIIFEPNTLPAVGTELTISYSHGPKEEDTFSGVAPNAAGHVIVNASAGSIIAGSAEVEWTVSVPTASYSGAVLAEMGIPAPATMTVRAFDDGTGHLVIYPAAGGTPTTVGTINYATGQVAIQSTSQGVLISMPNYASTWSSASGNFRLWYQGVAPTFVIGLYTSTGAQVKLFYRAAGSPSSASETRVFAPAFKLVPGVTSAIVPGSVLLAPPASSAAPWGDSGTGTLRERTSSGWLTRGTINYLNGEVTLSSWPTGMTNALKRRSCVTTAGAPVSSEYVFRTAVAPLRPGSLSIQFARASGGTQTVTANAAGVISASGVSGTVDHDSGLVRLRFGQMVSAAGNESEPWYNAAFVESGQIFKPEPVAMETVRYTAVAFSYLPLDAALLGLDPVRLPSDGRVPIFRPGSIAVVGHTGRITQTVSNGQTIDCGRVRLSRVRVVGHDGAVIHAGYSADLEAGTVTFANVSGYSQPVTIEHRIEDMVVVSDAQIDGTVSFTRPLTHVYPVATGGDPRTGAFVASALIAGDLFARVSLVFDQATWNGTWSDDVQGAPATGTFNQAQYPITVTNAGALTERWAIRFTNTSSFEVIGEGVGLIATGNTTTNCAPLNPATGQPYFTIPAPGWGGGWATGNVLRFNTVGAMHPVWCVRTVQQGPETVTNDDFTLLVRGDVDNPVTP